MPRQVPFTEYEAALLLDAYLKTLSGEKERMESVRDCSLQLRQMALNAGSEIDDIYRNVNGISFQMASMESAYQGHTIMKPATRLFTEIVFLYRNDAARYRQLLKEAKGMASAKIDNEAVFMAWLAQNVSGIQLSELYLAFKEIEQQAKKVKIIRTSLYESLDPSTIKKVKAGVESSKIFKFTHKHQWGRITSALNYLLQFASQKATETQTQETARVEMVESVKELEIVPSPDISSNALLKENIKSTAVTHIETEQDMDQSGAATTVNFHRINSMAFSKPVSLSYFGEVKPESSWKGLYVDACKSLLDDYPDVFTRLKAESLHGSGKTWLVDAENLHLLAVPKQLEEGLFVETNRNASDLMKNLKWLLDECSVDYENVVITYTSKDEKKEASVPALVTTSAFQKKRYYRQDKEDFYHWLQDDQHMLQILTSLRTLVQNLQSPSGSTLCLVRLTTMRKDTRMKMRSSLCLLVYFPLWRNDSIFWNWLPRERANLTFSAMSASMAFSPMAVKSPEQRCSTISPVELPASLLGMTLWPLTK